MHIPDGFLDLKTAALTGALAATGLGIACHQTRLNLPRRRVPLLGLSAAFVFAAQMVNFPVAGGTSGHLIGGVLTAVLLGPSAAILVISCVLIVQCLAFADGGVTTLGANIFNMGLVGAGVGYFIYRLVRGFFPDAAGRLVAIALAAWISTVLAAAVCAGELAMSRTVAWNIALPAMTGVHALIGVGEALITVLVIFAISRSRPELLEGRPMTGGIREMLVYGLLISLGVAIFLAPLASTAPDGLDHVAENLGFRTLESPHSLPAPMPDYQLWFKSHGFSTALAGAVGTIIVFGLAWALARLLLAAPPMIMPWAGRWTMHRKILDNYSHLASPIHRLPAGIKLLTALLMILAAVASPWQIIVWGALGVLLLIIAIFSHVPGRFILHRLLVLEPFVVCVALLAIFQPHGVERAVQLAVRGTICLLVTILLVNTTPFSALLNTLRRAHVPSMIVTTLALMYRYLYVLGDESVRMRRACASRTFTTGKVRSWKTMATIVGQLFVRCSLRAERIYAAMAARGWQ